MSEKGVPVKVSRAASLRTDGLAFAGVQSVPKTTACPRIDGSMAWRSSSDSITSALSMAGSSGVVLSGGLARVFFGGIILVACSLSSTVA
jgi:hypothetical protein